MYFVVNVLCMWYCGVDVLLCMLNDVMVCK